MTAKKTVLTSAQLVAAVTGLAIIYGFITHGTFTYAYAFITNFWVGVIILISGLLVLITPTFLLMKKSRLIDHTTYGERFMEECEYKRVQANELICIGIYSISITAVVQLIVWLMFGN